MIRLYRIKHSDPNFGMTYSDTHLKEETANTSVCGVTPKPGEVWVEGYRLKCSNCIVAVANHAIASGAEGVSHG
jgi:hypothetical protein